MDSNGLLGRTKGMSVFMKKVELRCEEMVAVDGVARFLIRWLSYVGVLTPVQPFVTPNDDIKSRTVGRDCVRSLPMSHQIACT